jgi:hypothetical protein
MTVKIDALNGDINGPVWIPLGTLRLDDDGRSVIADPPDHPFLHRVLNFKIEVGKTMTQEEPELVTAQAEPARWLELLPLNFRSSYYRAIREDD